MKTKICKKCKEEKNICEFNKNNSHKDKLQNICKNCDKLKTKEYREKNADKYSQSQKNNYTKNKENRKILNKEYYNKNRDKIINRNKEYYYNNVDKYRITKKEWREENKESVSIKSKEYRQKNRKLLSEYEKNRRDVDPLFKTIRYVRNRINQYLKSKNFKKNSKSFDLVGCSPMFLKEYIESQFTEGMSWELMGEFIHIDHKIPLSSGKNEDEVIKLCHYSNLQPLWSKDNLRKSNKLEC
jgi:hypothetical protein